MLVARQVLLLVAGCVLQACAPTAALSAAADITGGAFAGVGDDTVPRFIHRASLLNDGTVMVTGGLGISGFSLFSRSQVSFFDPDTNLFSSSYTPTRGGGPVSPALLTGRSGHTQTTLADGRVLITGGRIGATGTNTGTPTNSVEVFDPADGSVTAGPSMSAARSDHAATLLPDGRVVVAGGSTWQVFDPGDDSWSAAHALQRTRTWHAAVLLADHRTPGAQRVLIIGGGGSGPDTMELLDPSSGNSTLLTSTLDVGVDDLGAAALPDGTVLIVGGQDLSNGDTLGLTYRFDVGADELTPLDAPPNRAGGISDHQVIAFGNHVAIFGGEQQVSGTDTELDYAALFDANTNQWVWSGTMNHVHDDFASVLLNDGRILLIGGGVPFLGQAIPSDNCETFTPTEPRPADVNCDAMVGILDLLAVLAAWGPCSDLPCNLNCPEDIDGSCDVDILDLLALLADWG